MFVAIAAFFDVDGTLTQTTIIHPLVWYHHAHLSGLHKLLWSLELLLQVPRYWLIDRRSRSRFTTVFYSRYANLKAAELRAWHRQTFPENLRRTIFPAGLDCLRQHQRQGHRIVLVTGGLDFVMEPLLDYLHADDLLAAKLQEQDGIFTGQLQGPPMVDEEKALLMRACEHPKTGDAIDLSQSFAYGNSWSDVPMLSCVGHPIAVNPDRRLKRLARERGWQVVRWRLA